MKTALEKTKSAQRDLSSGSEKQSKKQASNKDLSDSEDSTLIHEMSSSGKDNEDQFEAGKRLIEKFMGGKYWALYVDIFLLFSVSIAYGVVLYLNESLLGLIFLVFTAICCTMTSLNYYSEVKDEINVTLKDVELLLRSQLDK